MKKTFQTRMEAIDWIADYVSNEGQFEVLREQLNFNFIYTGKIYLEVPSEDELTEVVFLKNKK